MVNDYTMPPSADYALFFYQSSTPGRAKARGLLGLLAVRDTIVDFEDSFKTDSGADTCAFAEDDFAAVRKQEAGGAAQNGSEIRRYDRSRERPGCFEARNQASREPAFPNPAIWVFTGTFCFAKPYHMEDGAKGTKKKKITAL